MGTVQQSGKVVAWKDGRTRRFRSKQERRQIVEETLKPGASVSLVAIGCHGCRGCRFWASLRRDCQRGLACQPFERFDFRSGVLPTDALTDRTVSFVPRSPKKI